MHLFPGVEILAPRLLQSSPPINVAEQQLALEVRVHAPIVQHHLIHQLAITKLN